jgi:hypothetical protein
VTSEVDRKPAYGEAEKEERARQAFDRETFQLVEPKRLLGWDVVYVTSVDRPAELEARALPLFKKRGAVRSCVVAIELGLRHPSSEIVVDWSKVSFVVDGVARAAVPGFARQMTSSLAQRPSTAPAGALLNEQVYALDAAGDACISERFGVLVADVPLKIGGVDDRLRVTTEIEPVSVTEAAAFAYIPEPGVRPDPAMKAAPGLTGTLVGLGAGAGAGVACGGLLLLAGVATNAPNSVPVGAGSALGFGVLFGGAGAAGGYFFVDSPAQQQWQHDANELAEQRRETARRDAWRRRRAELIR